MKIISSSLLAILLTSCISGKDISYTGSTPGGAVIKNFLGISLSDSIDFIRWKLTINDVRYTLQCNYGIGKPNTNGFIGGGKKIDLDGQVKREGNIFSLKNGSKVLKIAECNEGNKPGSWKIIKGTEGRIVYQLYDNKGNTILNLLKSHDNILLFTDNAGKLLVGDEDFSYTLNRRS